jgi:hypothetical protein
MLKTKFEEDLEFFFSKQILISVFSDVQRSIIFFYCLQSMWEFIVSFQWEFRRTGEKEKDNARAWG